MRTLVSALAIIALGASCYPVRAEAPCPELTRLRSEAADAAKLRSSAPTRDRCEAYIRFSMAWAEIAEYARDHRESCDISQGSLDAMEKRHREAVHERKELCAGRPGRRFPAEIIKR
jgi:hypothetical protein